MPLGKSILIVGFFTLFFINPVNSHDTKQLDKWLEHCPNNQFCFEHPVSLILANVQAIDSIAGQLENKNLILTYDLGRYASTFSELSSATSELIIIDGHHGRILIQQNKMALTIANVSGNTSFSMLIEFKNTIELDQGKRIFKSVKFKP
ncbi:hypothetical protein [Cognaticolwellia beringensis]|uniref:Uncharacterized protein n=1 Tax=Cognaticolwellia beringensis TaxID=1967665 RepID=A0A222G5Q1_9GAMM|nr:hypothetical protein [Cognaticolwellia beringensis]ASP47062.1 hypothetical protein B5D82_04315 [Cognaticolwellia beringensis]